MPARSNPFQKLIFRIHEVLAPVGVKVIIEESAFTEEPSSGANRETDVKIILQSPTGKERIAIECRNHSRVQGVEWIDELIGKYIDLGYDRVIAVSSSGFSKTALAKAEKFTIECRVLEEVLDTNWPAEFVKIGLATVTHRPVNMQFTLTCVPPLTEIDEVHDVVTDSSGREHGFAAFKKWMEFQARDYFLSIRAALFKVLADFDEKYGIEIKRNLTKMFITHGGIRHSIVRYRVACTIITSRTEHKVKHQGYPGAVVSTSRDVLGNELTVIQKSEEHPRVFKGEKLEEIKINLFDSAKESKPSAIPGSL